MNNIIIEGFMGSGKGSVGKKLAAQFNLPLIDTDKRISERMKMTPAEIYDRFGDIYYRAMETFVLSELTELKERSIILIGSGLPTMPQNERYLKELGTVYYLRTDQKAIVERIERSKKNDWLEENDDLKERVARLLEEREPSYLEAADVVIEVGMGTSQDACDMIARILLTEAADKQAEASAAVSEAEESAEAEGVEATEAGKADGAAEAESAAEAETAAEAVSEDTAANTASEENAVGTGEEG